ncbi:MAG: hypothetical protein ACI9XO_002761 [Paraglaciecola sp.]|jgi:hypothetical protein
MNRIICFIIGLSLFLVACQQKSDTQPIFKTVKTASENGGESNLFVSETGEVYLSWVEYLGDTMDILYFSKLKNEQWSTPKEITRGKDWFVNWADFPSLVTYKTGGKNLAAYWLEKSANGTYDYDIHIIQSQDSGNNWGNEFIIHRDSIAAEHGFMTMVPLSNDRIFATWLDGRNTKTDQEDPVENHGHSHGGAMTLRTAEFDIGDHVFEEAELDNRICDCCQTDAALTADGAIVVYRDRSEQEIRDIAIVRKEKGQWTTPHLVHADNWEIAGCPVNGPAVSAIERTVAVAWFTAANAKPTVKISFSQDSGKTFESPIIVSNHTPLGRVDVELLSKKEAIVSWLEETDNGAAIFAKKIARNGETEENILLTETDPSRQSGFPTMVKMPDQMVYSWTAIDSVTTMTKIKTGILTW